MSDKPMVVCIMLVDGRPEMVQRAIACWDAQTYPADRRRLVGWDTGSVSFCGTLPEASGLIWQYDPGAEKSSIGALRNAANRYAVDRCGAPGGESILLAHWDSDDYSHPLRLAEQVDYLQSSGRAVVGYNEMLFWDTTKSARVRRMVDITAGGLMGTEPDAHKRFIPGYTEIFAGEAWLYTNANPAQPLGTSLLYTAAAWEHCRFADLTRPHTGRSAGGEDTDFLARQLKPMPRAVSSVYLDPGMARGPRMIASLHGENTSSKITHNVPEWRRVPEWDDYCRKTMEAK